MNEPEVPHYETAFLIVKRKDGTYFATIDFDHPLTLQKRANRQDIRNGCREIEEVLKNAVLAQTIITKLNEESATSTERATSSIRQALSEKGIL